MMTDTTTRIVKTNEIGRAREIKNKMIAELANGQYDEISVTYHNETRPYYWLIVATKETPR